ncbi:copper chaperone PCu(A)C [Gulosibacter sediminis]|uniref:copper chaperone PCu(A)C n=1 Tax=Gulosibacter sediminis TaxID=1729695 RepID=UPI0024AE004E|nr:copper chaperone PCu(A)C [Gulosibacter sediminis]
MSIFRTTTTTIRPLTALAAAGLIALTLAGCSQAEAGATDAALTVTDPWVKATDTDMTGVFASIKNTSGHDVVIESATVEGASMTELHETIVQSDGSSLMQEIEGGFAIADGETLELQPGGNHIMPMDLDSAIEPGDEVAVTLTLDDGTEVDFTATAKEYTGAEESYAPESGHEGH